MDQHTGKETSTKTRSSLSWWQRAVIYQIAPLSFQDSNGDGKGDLNGILQRIDYVAWVGVDAVWLCPIYPSPMLDFGKDIADFCAVGAQFGLIADFDCLLDGQERIAAMLAFTLPGTAFCFGGDELGMRGVKIPSNRINDEFEKRVPEYGLNRDPERAPMRWDSGPKAGFTAGQPWLPLGADVAECNARLQQKPAINPPALSPTPGAATQTCRPYGGRVSPVAKRQSNPPIRVPVRGERVIDRAQHELRATAARNRAYQSDPTIDLSRSRRMLRNQHHAAHERRAYPRLLTLNNEPPEMRRGVRFPANGP